MDYLIPDLNLKGAFDVLAESTLKVGHQFPYDGIWAFSGSQGSGKTLLMMHLVRQMIEDDSLEYLNFRSTLYSF